MTTRRVLLVLLGLLVARAAWTRSYHEVAWPDECIYLVGARNVVEHGSLDTNYYLTHSLLARGYPHRDVHMPGFVLVLAPFVAAFGATLLAGSVLNVLLYVLAILLTHALARALLEDEAQALGAAALFAILPPLPGYLFVVFPEIAVVFALLVAWVWLVSGHGTRHAFVAGVLYALGALLRETLLLSLPVYLVRIPRRALLRGFLPGALATLLVVVAPLSGNRALHPNAIYPGVIEEARRSADPLGTLVDGLLVNLRLNLGAIADADPLARAEDAVLALMLAMALATLLVRRRLAPPARRLAGATLVALALLTGAVMVLYVVRERGGVWGGVRAYMMLSPPLAIFAAAALFRCPPRIRSGLIAACVVAFLALDARQLYFFLRYKGSNHDDQGRYARYVAGYVAQGAPRRIVGRLFLYGLEHYPTEIVWQYPRDYAELRALERAIGFDYLVVNGANPLRLFVIQNPRYVRVNRDDRDAELLIFRRLD